MKRKLHISALSLLLFCLTHNAIAQTTATGGLTGMVSDPTGAVVPSAGVNIRDDAKGTVQAAETDRDGVYRFFFLAPGQYTLSVSHQGFRPETRTINILLGPPETLNIALVVANETATVEVTAEAPLIQAENGDVSAARSQKQISEVPNPGNDLTYIAQTAPGAIMNTDSIGSYGGGNFSILGMPATSNLFTLNGMNNNNPVFNINNSGVLGMLLGQNEVQEASVVINGYSAQFGGAAGANVSYVTKSGGNALHGNAQYYWNGTSLNANDWLSNAFGIPRPPDSAHQWAGSLGGPIRKDKLFFFFDSEGMNVLMPAGNTVVLPSKQFEAATMANIDSIFGPGSPSHQFYKQIFDLYNSAPGAQTALPGGFFDALGCGGWVNPNDPNGLGKSEPCAVHYLTNLGAPSNQWLVAGRLDWNLRARDRMFLWIQHDNGSLPNYVDPISPLFTSIARQPTWQAQLNETHTLGPTAANQFLLAATHIKNRTGVANPSQAHAAFPVVLNWWLSGEFSVLGGLNYIFGQPTGSTTISNQISDDMVKTSGKHKLGLGMGFQRTYWSGWGFNWNGIPQLLPQTIDAFFFGGVDPSSPKTDFTTISQTFPASQWNDSRFYSLGLYLHEEWRAHSNLTFSLGVRADHHSNPVCESQHCFARMTGPFSTVSHDPNQPYNQTIRTDLKQAFPNTDVLVWSPRFSFAWQPFGVSRNTVVRGGIGVFYDQLQGWGVNPSSNPPAIDAYNISGYNLAPNENNSLSKNATASHDEFLKGFATGETFAQMRTANPNFTAPQMDTLPSTVHWPQFQKWSLQAQQVFGVSRSFTVSYFGNHGLHEPFLNGNANAFGFGSLPSKPCGSPPIAPCYDSRFGSVWEIQTAGVSNYNGLVASFEQRFTRWGSGALQANYTYGHALDVVSNEAQVFTGSSSSNPQDVNHLHDSYGAADYDVRHSFNANYFWELPLKAALRGHGKDALVNGWQISGVVLAHTGFPYTVFDNGEMGLLASNNFGGPIYAVPASPLGSQGPCGKGAAIPSAITPCLPPQVLSNGSPNPTALFIQTGCETGFNTGYLPGPNGPCGGHSVSFSQGRNHFRGPALVSVDFAVMKNTKIPIKEAWEWSMGLQFFNLFNHPNFSLADHWLTDSGYGRIFYLEQSSTSILGATGADVARRMIQLKFQFRF